MKIIRLVVCTIGMAGFVWLIADCVLNEDRAPWTQASWEETQSGAQP